MPETTNSAGMESAERRSGPSIVAIVQSDIDLDMFGKVFLVDGDGTAVTLPSLHTFGRYFAHGDNAVEWEAKGSLPFLINNERRFKEREEKKIVESMGAENFAKVLACERMVFLVNSPGGHAKTGNVLKRLAANVKRNGGTVEGFIGNNAASAAADLLASMDERTALTGTEFMWHASQHPTIKRTDEETKQEAGEMVQFFEQNIQRNAEAIRGKLEAEINDASNPDNEVTFDGAELAEAGILAAVPNVKSLKRTIGERHPELALATGAARRRLDLFFLGNMLEEAVRRKFGVSIIMHADDRLAILWPKGVSEDVRQNVKEFLNGLTNGIVRF